MLPVREFMSFRKLLVFQIAFWICAAGLLFLYGLFYGHWHVALIRNLYFPVLAFLLSFGFVAVLRREAVHELGRWRYAVAAALCGTGALLTALVLNPITFGLLGSALVSRPVPILSIDTLYFALFYGLWSLLFLQMEERRETAVEASSLSALTVGQGADLRRLDVADLECLLAEGGLCFALRRGEELPQTRNPDGPSQGSGCSDLCPGPSQRRRKPREGCAREGVAQGGV